MKTKIKIGLILLFAQLSYAEIVSISTVRDSLPIQDMQIGITSGFISDGVLSTAYQVGLTTEFNINKSFALEVELNYEFKNIDHQRFDSGKKKEINFDLGLNTKYYLDNKKLWFAKVGYTFNNHILDIYEEDYKHGNEQDQDRTYGLQVGFGYNLSLGKRVLRFEPIFRYNKIESLKSGLKIGFQF